MTVADTQIVGAFSAAFTALTTVIVVMWRKLSVEHAKLEVRANESDQKHDECQQDRNELAVEIGKMTGNAMLLARCPGGHQGTCPYWTDSQLAKRATSRVHLRPSDTPPPHSEPQAT